MMTLEDCFTLIEIKNEELLSEIDVYVVSIKKFSFLVLDTRTIFVCSVSSPSG